MPDKRTHRGAHPEDGRLFAPEMWPRMRSAVEDLSWLLSRGYAETSSLKLVGDRYHLLQRQRIAVMRCACSDQARQRRTRHCVELDAIEGQLLLLDGYNILTTIEAALAGGVILWARDGCYRDMASMHGTYRQVEETIPAVRQLGQFLAEARVGECRWYLDRPVSNSGRLKKVMEDMASAAGWNWRVQLVRNPDTILARSEAAVVTADSAILDRADAWVNLSRPLIEANIPEAYLVDLSAHR